MFTAFLQAFLADECLGLAFRRRTLRLDEFFLVLVVYSSTEGAFAINSLHKGICGGREEMICFMKREF